MEDKNNEVKYKALLQAQYHRLKLQGDPYQFVHVLLVTKGVLPTYEQFCEMRRGEIEAERSCAPKLPIARRVPIQSPNPTTDAQVSTATPHQSTPTVITKEEPDEHQMSTAPVLTPDVFSPANALQDMFGNSDNIQPLETRSTNTLYVTPTPSPSSDFGIKKINISNSLQIIPVSVPPIPICITKIDTHSTEKIAKAQTNSTGPSLTMSKVTSRTNQDYLGQPSNNEVTVTPVSSMTVGTEFTNIGIDVSIAKLQPHTALKPSNSALTKVCQEPSGGSISRQTTITSALPLSIPRKKPVLAPLVPVVTDFPMHIVSSSSQLINSQIPLGTPLQNQMKSKPQVSTSGSTSQIINSKSITDTSHATIKLSEDPGSGSQTFFPKQSIATPNQLVAPLIAAPAPSMPLLDEPEEETSLSQLFPSRPSIANNVDRPVLPSKTSAILTRDAGYPPVSSKEPVLKLNATTLTSVANNDNAATQKSKTLNKHYTQNDYNLKDLCIPLINVKSYGVCKKKGASTSPEASKATHNCNKDSERDSDQKVKGLLQNRKSTQRDTAELGANDKPPVKKHKLNNMAVTSTNDLKMIISLSPPLISKENINDDKKNSSDARKMRTEKQPKQSISTPQCSIPKKAIAAQEPAEPRRVPKQCKELSKDSVKGPNDGIDEERIKEKMDCRKQKLSISSKNTSCPVVTESYHTKQNTTTTHLDEVSTHDKNMKSTVKCRTTEQRSNQEQQNRSKSKRSVTADSHTQKQTSFEPKSKKTKRDSDSKDYEKNLTSDKQSLQKSCVKINRTHCKNSGKGGHELTKKYNDSDAMKDGKQSNTRKNNDEKKDQRKIKKNGEGDKPLLSKISETLSTKEIHEDNYSNVNTFKGAISKLARPKDAQISDKAGKQKLLKPDEQKESKKQEAQLFLSSLRETQSRITTASSNQVICLPTDTTATADFDVGKLHIVPLREIRRGKVVTFEQVKWDMMTCYSCHSRFCSFQDWCDHHTPKGLCPRLSL